MSNILALTRPDTISALSPNLASVCLFSLLGLTLSAAVLSYVSPETIAVMVSSAG